jgi:hypothetical protein
VTPAPSLVSLFVAPLNRASIEYMVTGGLAAVVYGHPRLTLDVDLVLRLAARDAERFVSLWSPADFYSPPAEVVEAERVRDDHGHFNLIHNKTALRADIYLAGTDEFQDWGLRNRVGKTVDGETVWFAPIEYVIVYKLRYFQMGGSDRHLRDVARMLEINDATVDVETLERWIDRFNLRASWQRARSFDA